jgi:hypothetical protein
MNAKKLEVFDELIAFRAWKEDREDLSRVASAWQLEEAEVARRALRAGLKLLEKIKLPGVRPERNR